MFKCIKILWCVTVVLFQFTFVVGSIGVVIWRVSRVDMLAY